ncbi:hypothetical protein [Bradyrhizobium liaoningense]
MPDKIALCDAEGRGRLLDFIVSEFRRAFPKIEYEIDTQTRIVNAQAFLANGHRVVRIYGGLGFHPLANNDALVFTFLHETGHHFADGRRFAGNPSLACDCLADKWAVTAGARALRRCSGRVLNLANAFVSLEAILLSMDVRFGPASKGRCQQSQTCWANSWRARKARLSTRGAFVPKGPCYFNS